ncbi:hypothetical protein CJ739_1780 [Mariniflexile rhizosphaerae]|uniref:DUF6520 family protein n=1 Tax=unclassified Mariniflexile TaxID=2643887 RepID=UPI000CB155C0|nr:DUF6520 family protein [Mariniflexile sp. TRM1-10]AXP80866.1 hypothetical protein CJ739_1780 [Mariniflexile sp. TRM1-10]PLB17964.1 MAG: hypothetical protein TRG1_3220 [Flavobacteriaceae bacterium FS1-H7996/R]
MKSKIFKIVLPAFALVFAITASLAFTPAENGKAEDAPVNKGWYQNPDANNCVQIMPIQCQTDIAPQICTTIVFGVERQLFYTATGDITTPCNITLYKRPNGNGQ